MTEYYGCKIQVCLSTRHGILACRRAAAMKRCRPGFIGRVKSLAGCHASISAVLGRTVSPAVKISPATVGAAPLRNIAPKCARADGAKEELLPVVTCSRTSLWRPQCCNNPPKEGLACTEGRLRRMHRQLSSAIGMMVTSVALPREYDEALRLLYQHSLLICLTTSAACDTPTLHFGTAPVLLGAWCSGWQHNKRCHN